MRSISIKITLVLVVVSLVGALFTAFYIQNRTRKAFDTFIQGQDQLELVDALEDHYLTNRNWENVEQVFKDIFPFAVHNNQGGDRTGKTPNKPNDGFGVPFILASPSGEILYDNPGAGGGPTYKSIPIEDLEKGYPLEIDDQIVAWLLPAAFQRPRNNNQVDFLDTVQKGLIISSVVTLLIALILGGFLIQSFTRPIRKLANATEVVASGELGYQVDIKSGDELGKLAASFNIMSKDLERADHTRKQMTADIAHDLRSPLSVLHGYTEAMSTGKMAGDPEIYKVMHQQAQHLNYLIEDLRTLSLLDAGELGFQIQNIDPVPILQQTVAALAPLATGHQVQLDLNIKGDLPRVNLDPDRLTQILGNLINNAIQVLPPGGKIELSAGEDNEQLILQVIDDGPGISAEDLPRLFDRSFRTDKSRQSENGSSGLGLAITKKLVEGMRGKITVDSSLKKGTLFNLVFPIN